jgi:hypothetical protein
MIQKIAFNVIAFGMLGGLLYFQLKLFSVGMSLREKVESLKGRTFSNDFGFVRECKRILESTSDESIRTTITQYLKYRRLQMYILLFGVVLLIAIVAFQ